MKKKIKTCEAMMKVPYSYSHGVVWKERKCTAPQEPNSKYCRLCLMVKEQIKKVYSSIDLSKQIKDNTKKL